MKYGKSQAAFQELKRKAIKGISLNFKKCPPFNFTNYNSFIYIDIQQLKQSYSIKCHILI